MRNFKNSLRRRSFIIIGSAGLVGCSMHPIPYDVTRVSTPQIVERIRCEAKEGLASIVDRYPNHPILKHTAIGFDFKFEITEDNDLKEGGLDLQRNGFRDGSLAKWGFTGSATRNCKNIRQFRIIETLDMLNSANCVETATRQNWIYPIVGSIGMKEVVETYLRIEGMTNFGPGADGTKLKSNSIVFSDDLDYTTEFGGSVTPTLELATIAGKFRLTKATVMASANRKDIHSVTVALAQDGQPVDLPPGMRAFRDGPPTGRELARRGMGIAGGSAGFQSRAGARALDAAIVRSTPAKDRVLAELERRRQLKEDERVADRLIEVLRRDP